MRGFKFVGKTMLSRHVIPTYVGTQKLELYNLIHLVTGGRRYDERGGSFMRRLQP